MYFSYSYCDISFSEFSCWLCAVGHNIYKVYPFLYLVFINNGINFTQMFENSRNLNPKILSNNRFLASDDANSPFEKIRKKACFDL